MDSGYAFAIEVLEKVVQIWLPSGNLSGMDAQFFHARKQRGAI